MRIGFTFVLLELECAQGGELHGIYGKCLLVSEEELKSMIGSSGRSMCKAWPRLRFIFARRPAGSQMGEDNTVSGERRDGVFVVGVFFLCKYYDRA